MNDRQTGAAEGVRLRSRRRPRRWTKRRRTLFLETLAESCNVSAAARKAGMDRSSAYDLKDRDPAFARGWGAALEQAYGALEWRLMEVSTHGTVRTEMVIDKDSRQPTHIKLVHSYPLTVAFRLFLSHRAEVAAFRIAQAQTPESEDAVGVRVLRQMDEVRARLLAPAAAEIWGEAQDELGAGDADHEHDAGQ